MYVIQAAILAAFVGCGGGESAWCTTRSDDSDCDGVPDGWDRCDETPMGARTDSRGCAEAQVAGCSVQALSPESGARLSGPARFRWSGTCDMWLLQFSDDPSFPAGATRTAVRTDVQQADATGTERYWRVVGGMHGVSAGATSSVQEVRKWQ